MIIQEKGQTKITAYAAVRKDSSNGKLSIDRRTINPDFNLTKILTSQFRDAYPGMWEENAMPLEGYCKLEITAEMLPFKGTSVLIGR